jgi:hypothetical protein
VVDDSVSLYIDKDTESFCRLAIICAYGGFMSDLINTLLISRISEFYNHRDDPHRSERKAADDAEDTLIGKLTEDLQAELRKMINLRAGLTELETADLYADGFRCGVIFMLDTLRPG